MPPLITNLSGTTELEAINTMLAAIGEAPYASITEFSAGNTVDAQMALSILRNVTRDAQSMGWKFNTEFGYELAPTSTYAWVDTAGITTSLKIFTPPANLAGFTVTKIPAQQGSRLVDTEIRPSRKYTPGTLVFYDRDKARDGFVAANHPFLYINPIWLFDFEKMPEVARKYITVKAAREFSESVLGSATLAKFSERNEQIALRTLKREQGNEDNYSYLQNSDVSRARGRRPGGAFGVHDPRTNRGSV